jgi:tRNA threonylcarbamoyladenosine biosynthesis protein TsaE
MTTIIARPDPRDSLTLSLPDERATEDLGARLAPLLRPGMVVHLAGDLGAGKTTLVRGVLRALGFRGPVKSPTYTLVELYATSRLDLYHFDFYRFSQPEEYLDAGLDEYFGGDGICLVEWPEKAGAYLRGADLRIVLTIVGDTRAAELQALSDAGTQCLTGFRSSPG